MSTYTYFPRCNPIPFRGRGTAGNVATIDYTNTLPRFDLMVPPTQYIKGEYPIQNFKQNWVINEQLLLQYRRGGTMILFEEGEYSSSSGSFTRTDITPVGWAADNVYKYTLTPLNPGNYWIKFSSPGNWEFRTDIFTIHEDIFVDKGLIKLEYRNNPNDFGMVFEDDVYYKAFYTGKYKPAQDSQENTVTITDTGVSKQKSNNNAGIKVLFTDMPNIYYQQLCKQLQCNDLKFNGVKCVCNEVPEIVESDKTNVIDVSVTLLYQGSNDYLDIYL